jgi:RNA polymerase sigma-70 factor (sigma-E family)
VEDAEEASFRDYAAHRLKSLRRLGYLVCGDWYLAEDALSNVMAKLYASWRSIRRNDNVDAYVRRMLIRAIVDERRRPWRRETTVEFPLSPQSQSLGDDMLNDRMVLREALSRMPPRRRAVLVLRYFEQLSVEETAAAMGCSTGTVKSQTARALATMRELIPADYLLQVRGTE